MGTRTRVVTARGMLPWLAGSLAALAAAGRVVAAREDEGDESTAGIRRVRTLARVALRPANPALSRVRLDLVLARGLVDLTGIPRVPRGVDVTVRAMLGGVTVRVPPDWGVWGQVVGVGTISGEACCTSDEAGADVRLHVRALLGGVALEQAR